jgi:DNA-binding transcriptional regulator YdaS (Cro superfamily)
MSKPDDTPLQRAALAAGNLSSLAKKLGVSRQAIYQWRRVPAQHVLKIEALTKVPRHTLRPDLYPQEAA